ncbi:MAG TPA: alanine--tRNA ligase [Pyrinomonadaceae bacterium]|nr:alanine--tRNA ligase [Pyrinomonadaceae bacterium]
MTGSEIREKFLEYFERQGHTRVRSSPLLPANDPTLLFTNAGMNQFKDVFLGAEKRDYVRACSSQKCVRAGGKHNDLDEVGKTARHQTFFEMLGNFSFGDYFKEDAIKFAWDLLVNEFKLDPARMWFTVFEGDAEVGPDEDAEKFWEQVGAPRERILRFGRKDNFWQMGETGPCGPCSEVHYYMGEDPSDVENSVANVNGPGDTITEIWNLVFMQFERSEVEAGKYKLDPLPAPSVDTGMGLERLAVVLQGVKSNYETDLLKNIVDFVAQLSDRHYEAETQEGFAMRVIADHARATAFSIADGILPANEGRNYVLRKIMRRAIYQGRHTLEFDGLFFHEVTNFVVDQMGEAYPELESHREFIEKMVKLEEERFGSTLTVGLQKLDEIFAKTGAGQTPSYVDLARLYDTFGTPRDLIRVSLEERGSAIDENEFNESFDAALQQLQQTGASEKAEGKAKTKPIYAQVASRIQSMFRGYETTRIDDGKVCYLIKGDEEVQALNEGDEGEVVLDQTPFYAESGGQVGDVGQLYTSGPGVLPVEHAQDARATSIASVLDTSSPAQGLIVHKVKIEKGTIKIGDTVTAEVDVEKRDATRRNHTATHLVHAALREVLGTHVKQAGSVVAPNYLRFDFNHYQPMTEDEIKEVERLVNEQVLRNVKVDTDIMPVEDAIRAGAMALFGEKYSGMMRVLTVPGFSKELCGGTHVRATGDIGVFKITSDESIASGVRRIRALTGFDAYERFREDERLIDEAAANLRTSRAELPHVIGKLQDELKKARREAEELKLKIASGAISTSASNGDEARDIAGVRVLAKEASGLDAAGMRQLSDTLLERIKSGVVVLGRTNDGKASLIVRTSDDLTKKIPAGQVIKELAPIIGGRGGGKADMAEGGGSQPEKLAEALQASYGVIEKMLS